MSLKNITIRINNSTETVQTQQIVGGEGGNGLGLSLGLINPILIDNEGGNAGGSK